MAKEVHESRQAMSGDLPESPHSPTIDGMDAATFLRAQQMAEEQGKTLMMADDGSAWSPENGGRGGESAPEDTTDYDQRDIYQEQSLLNPREQAPAPTRLWGSMDSYNMAPYAARDKAQVDSILIGDNSRFAEFEQTYRMNGTVEDEMIAEMEKMYNEELIDTGVFEDFDQFSDEEKIAAITSEWQRVDTLKQTKRNLVALNMIRQGLGHLPTAALDRVVLSLSPQQTIDLMDQYRRAQTKQLQRTIDKIAAREGEGFTGAAATQEIIEQDIFPFWGAITRVAASREFMPEGLEIGTLRALLPGELRQEIREWWVTANNDERNMWLQELDRKFSEVRDGPDRGIYTRYVVIENLMGLFTPEMMDFNNPEDSIDRIMGNLDVALGALIAGGLIAKRGRSIFELWSTPKHGTARQLAAAGGSRPEQSELGKTIEALATDEGFSKADAAIKDVVKPKQMELDLEVDTDSVKHTTSPNEARLQRILDNTDDADITLLNKEDKLNVVKQELDDISGSDTVHPMHKMSTVRALPNDTGVEFNIVYGPRPDEAWDDLGALIDDLVDLDPDVLDDFKILRRTEDGTLEDLGLTRSEILDYHRTGRISAKMEEFLDLEDSYTEVSRLFGGRRLSSISSDELAGALESSWVPPDSPAYPIIRGELTARNLGKGEGDALSLIDGNELFIQRSHTRYYMPSDKMDMGDAFKYWDVPFLHSAVRFLGRLFPPNAKFDKVYEATRQGYHMEEAAHQEFNDILQPFYKLNAKEQQDVSTIIEYVEDYAKDMYHEGGIAKMPSVGRILADNPGISDNVMEGYLALREALDGLYDVFSRRIYKDFNNRGMVTIRGTREGLPNFHGKAVMNPKAGTYYNPVSRKMEKVTEEEMALLVEEGGGALKLDFAITAPEGGKYDQILVRKGDYEYGKLSKKPLSYYEGYHFRFYEDPYYIVKRDYGATVNGVKLPDGEFVEEAIRTAGTFQEGMRFLNRGRGKHRGKWIDNGKGELINISHGNSKTRFVIKPAKSISNTEGSLYQQQALQREGRLFWDERSRERLPDVTGNRAPIADPARAVQKGLAVALRQTTQEGLFDSMRVGFKNEYGDLPIAAEFPSKFNTDTLEQLEAAFTTAKMNSHGNTRARYNEAIEILRYMRSQLGTNAFMVPHLRDWMVQAAKWIDVGSPSKARKAVARNLTRYGMSTDPFSTMRKIAYNALMVFRPVRQAFLQSSQISMLTGLAPTYIGTGRIFMDAWALRRGVAKLRRAGFDDGWSDTKVAKAMGLTKKEYKRLVEEFNRSGLLGSVNTHAFNTAAGSPKPLLEEGAGTIGRMSYDVKAKGAKAHSWFAKGFEWGEQNNLTFSYLVALRRIKQKHGIDDITKFSRTQWNEVTSEADGLALAMTRPNKFGYQSGLVGVTMQFMSFQHRALLTFLGMNPKLTTKDTLKVVFGSYALWGTNILGMEDGARELLAQAGLTNHASDEFLPGITLQDLLTAGLIESFFNSIARTIDTDWKDLNIGVLAPGAAAVEIYKNIYEITAEKPLAMSWLGPMGSITEGFLAGLKFVEGDVMNNETRTPLEKLQRSATVLGRYTLPGLNDANRSWIAWQTGEWKSKGNDTLPMEPTHATIIARLGLGLRGEDEMAYYKMKTKQFESEENIRNWVSTWRPVIKEMVTMWGNKLYTDEQALELVSVIHSLTEDAPEGQRERIYRQLITEPDDKGQSIAELVAEMAAKGTSLLDAIPYVNQSTSLSAEDKATLTGIMQEIHEAGQVTDQKFMDSIQENIESKK